MSLTLFSVLGGAATDARAQERPFDPAIDVQLFEYATGLHSFLTVPDADVTGDGQFSIDFLLTFITDPFTIYNIDEPTDEIDGMDPIRTKVVENVLAGELGAAYGFRNEYEIGVALPMIFSMSGEGIDVTDARPGTGLQASGLGDLRAEFKWRFWQKERLRLAVIPGLTVPTSVGTNPGDDPELGSGDLLGDDLPTGRLRAAVQWSDGGGNLHAGGYIGAVFRKPRTVYSSEVGQQLMYGAGASYSITKSVDAIAEAFGRTGLTALDLEASPLEANGAVRIQATKALSVLAGGGAGLVKGIGSPQLRMFVSVGWSPDFRDSDGDGIANNKDKCPLLAEDKDGYEDSDGCPDDDNDGDKREDSIDKCPLEAEDLDGFEDDDGCPEADNDNDGFLDRDDRCPVDAEDGKPPYDKDGCPATKRDSDDDGTYDAYDACPDEMEDEDDFEDWDGCPDVDNDGDDIPDEFDACPLCREDRDNFEDDDGCPEPDNDNDGVPDANDKCPDEAEVINGVDDFDGCADSGGRTVAELDGDRIALSADIRFRRRRSTIDRGSVDVVDQVAAVMLGNPDVVKWRIVVVAKPGRSEDEGDAKRRAQERADSVKAHIVSRGVGDDHIEAIGAASNNEMVAIVVLERAAGGDDDTPKLCPDGMQAIEREPPDEPQAVEPVPATPAEPEPAEAPEPAPERVEAPEQPEPAKPAAVPSDFDRYAGVVKGLSFRRNKSELRGGSKRTLGKVAELLEQHPAVHIEIKTHTDSRKGPEESKKITDAQAQVLEAYFLEQGIAAERIKAAGYGMDEPIDDNAKSKGRAKNRRVEFSFTIGE